MPIRPVLLAFIAVALLASHTARGQEDEVGEPNGFSTTAGDVLPTRHPPLPSDLSGYWVAPSGARPTAAALRFAEGAALIAAGDHARGLPLVSAPELERTSLGAYARHYRAAALVGLERIPEADALLRAAADRDLQGYLREALPLQAAETAIAVGDPTRALDRLDDLRDGTLLAPEAVWLQVGRAAERAADVDLALDAFRTLYYDFPASAEAAEAQTAIARLQTVDRIPPNLYTLELDRAQALFNMGRWAQARAGFEPLAAVAQGDDKALIAVRLAECAYYLNRYQASRDALRAHLEGGSLEAEARYFHLTATRALGDRASYVRLARQLVTDHPDSPWAADTLHALATHYITIDQDDEADQVFRELLRRFPRHPHSERAAWRVGWRAYRAGNFREAAETFDRGAVTFPRADYRPSWLYWSGRARTQLGEPVQAADRYAVTIADYQNSYYGRLAMQAVESRPEIVLRTVAAAPRVIATPAPIETEDLIRDLLALGLYDDALREVWYAQRAWGDSPRLQATVALIRHNQGLSLRAGERFAAVRGAITTMRRAYPQFMAAGGEHLPVAVLRVIFPIDYWPLITKYAGAHDLDPYLIVALMAQESTFTAEIRSSANAIGLMQIIPATGRRYATRLGVRNFTANALTQPELNVRLGTRYFKDLITRFGEAHYALAGYNAGENRVDRWLAERGPLPADEFIDDIPFPETQIYVKRILGTAEDYRRLYGGGLLDPNVTLAASSAPGTLPAAATLTRR